MKLELGVDSWLLTNVLFASWMLALAHCCNNSSNTAKQNRIPCDILVEKEKCDATTNYDHGDEKREQDGYKTPNQKKTIRSHPRLDVRFLSTFRHCDSPLSKSWKDHFIVPTCKRGWNRSAKNLRSIDGELTHCRNDSSGNLLPNKFSNVLALQKGRVASRWWIGSPLHGLLARILYQDTPPLRENNPKPRDLTKTQQKPGRQKPQGSESQTPTCCHVHPSAENLRRLSLHVKSAGASSFSVTTVQLIHGGEGGPNSNWSAARRWVERLALLSF